MALVHFNFIFNSKMFGRVFIMRNQSLYRKIMKARRLAGENPSTPEELAAKQIADDLEVKLHRKNRRTNLQQIAYGGLIPYDKESQIPKKENKKDKLLKIEKEKFVTIQVVPDTSTRNYKTEDISKLIVQLFKLPRDRFKKQGKNFVYKVQERVVFEIRIMKGEISFLFHVPESIETIFTKKLQTVWPAATIMQYCADTDFNYNQENSVIQELSYRKHDLYSLAVDSKNTDPLDSILESSRLLNDTDQASVYASFEPIHQLTIQTELMEVWRKLREGEAPKKWGFTFREIGFLFALAANDIFKGLAEILTDLFSSEADSKNNRYTKKYVADPEASKMTINNLSEATKKKAGKEILKVGYVVAAQSNNISHASVINQTICNGINDLAGDNDFIARELRGKKKAAVIQSLNTRTPIKINIKTNLMSVGESGRIMQIPGDELITKYPDIKSIKTKEVDIDKVLRYAGIKLGTVTFRGDKIPVFLPCTNYDEYCLPNVLIGQMGTGKSTSIINRAVECIKNGFGCIIIDPTKKEMGDLLEKILPPDKIERYNLAEKPFSLEWCEIYKLKKYKNRLANAIISFFNDQTDNAGARTIRYLKSIVYAMQTGKLKEVVDILENEKYRLKVINSMPDNIHKMTLQEFHNQSAAMQLQIKMPIYNRLDVILGDEFLSECMESENQLNLVDLMESGKCIIIDVPKSDLGSEGVDLVCNILSSKIDLAMTSRDQDNVKPVSIFFDELHQMQKSVEIWKSAAVESRKWRVQYNFILHSFSQIDRKLVDVIQAAGPNYCLFRSSAETFKKLEKEIYPLTIEDGTKLERFHAINIIQADGKVCTPFIAKMQKPL